MCSVCVVSVLRIVLVPVVHEHRRRVSIALSLFSVNSLLFTFR